MVNNESVFYELTKEDSIQGEFLRLFGNRPHIYDGSDVNTVTLKQMSDNQCEQLVGGINLIVSQL